MSIYLVGGAVRDQLLGITVKDFDWLMVGQNPEQLKQQGYQQVGKDFPIFLHPTTHEEYALPRGGLSVESEIAQVEADLIRRDLTINAIARDEHGNFIDPLNGRKDLQQKILRHTPYFQQDPIRILRLARFSARYQYLGFSIAAETKALIREMKTSGQLNHLVGERVWAEIESALRMKNASCFFQTLKDLAVLECFVTPLDKLFGVPQPALHHPEIDTGIHSLMVLDQACLLSNSVRVRWAALLHDVGKGLTLPERLPRHLGHEEAGIDSLKSLSKMLKISNDDRDLMIKSAQFHTLGHRALELTTKRLLKLILCFDSLRKPQNWYDFIYVCEADSRGRRGFETRQYPQAEFLRGALKALLTIDNQAIVAKVEGTMAIKDAIHRARLHGLHAYRYSVLKELKSLGLMSM